MNTCSAVNGENAVRITGVIVCVEDVFMASAGA